MARRSRSNAIRQLSRLPFLAPSPARRRAAAPRPAVRRGAGRWVRSTYGGPGGSRAYDVYLPAGHRRAVRVPLVLLLHGCNQTAEEFVAATRFPALADRHGFVLVAPRQTRSHHPGGCWRWFGPGHQVRGAGEPAALAGITAAVLAEPTRWRIDPARVYAAGISAGAGMAVVLAATYPDVFAAVGVHSGPAYRTARSAAGALAVMRGRGVLPETIAGSAFAPMVVVQGVADRVVHARNGDQVVEQWLAHDAARQPSGADPGPVTRSRTTDRRSADGRRVTVTRWYSRRGRKRLELWRVHGLGHAWSGGVRDGSYSDPRGPRASTAMWAFFAAQSL